MGRREAGIAVLQSPSAVPLSLAAAFRISLSFLKNDSGFQYKNVLYICANEKALETVFYVRKSKL